jgi:hypothetical protein
MNDSYLDINVSPRERKTKSDVMTVAMAIKCGKSSKSHKLHTCLNEKKDRTRSEEARKMSKKMRDNQSHV